MNMRLLLPLLALAPSLSCAPDYDDIPVKLVGVGYDPDEIGPSPTPYGGVVEYSWVNFAGGGLSLALMSLGSFDEVGPSMVGYRPPFAAVYGFSYIFDQKLAAADSLGGVTSVPPEVDDTCYTTFDASGPIGSFKTVDVGSWMDFSTEDGTSGFRMDRLPGDYPPNAQDLFIYYSTFDYWLADSIYGKVPAADSDRPGRMEDVVVKKANFPFGETVEYSFPGALAKQEAPVGSLPRPSSAVGNTSFELPSYPGGVQVSWDGPRYDAYGHVITEGGVQSTCLTYASPEVAPASAADCLGADTPDYSGFTGQMYTGPWDTNDGTVTFRWDAPTEPSAGEYVSLAVRFLGPVDREDTNYIEYVVKVPAGDDASAAWRSEVRADAISPDVEVPDGRRAPQPCETDGEWVFDDAYETADGNFSPALRGDPFNNVAELTCRLADDGEYSLTSAQLEEALTYARSRGAQGVVFYLARSTEVEAEVPAAMDQYRQKLKISPIKLTSRAIDIGRFWFEE